MKKETKLLTGIGVGFELLKDMKSTPLCIQLAIDPKVLI